MNATALPAPSLRAAPGFWARARRHPAFVIGGLLTLALLLAAALSYAWTPHSVYEVNMGDKLLPPSARFWLGTDAFGRDVVSQLLVGARASILVGVIAVGIGLIAGTGLGLLASARRGWVEEAIMRACDFGFAFPAILSAIMLTAVYGPGIVNAIIAIGIFNIPVFARVARAGALGLWPREFILAARAAGKGKVLITFEHILPNIANLLLVQGTIQFALGILAEASLSYVGLGAQPPMPSWGRMLFEAQTMIGIAPHMALFPGLAIVATVLGLNLLGDGLSDTLDPKLRRQR